MFLQEPTNDATLPPILDWNVGNNQLEKFLFEYDPLGPTEVAIVREMARQATAMERWGLAAEAVERYAAKCLPAIFESETNPDAVLAAAVSTDATTRTDRHALAHSRAFFRALEKLEELQSRRRNRELHGGRPDPPEVPPDEAACEQHLIDRFCKGECPCIRCGNLRGYFLPTHKAWECARCHAQVGLRAGTVMARSPLPLKTWFEAIRWTLWQPTISTRHLANRLGISRPPTVRNMARKIRRALAADDATRQLAGFDRNAGSFQGNRKAKFH